MAKTGTKTPISIVILTHNSADSLEATLESVAWASEIVVVDRQSEDETLELARKYKARIVKTRETNFAFNRNLGMKQAKEDWLLYLDSDEVITHALKKEIQKIVRDNQPAVYYVTRANNFLGTFMYRDKVERLFHHKLLKGWTGEVHESPQYEGEARTLDQEILHYTHTDIASMLAKTNDWSEVEAKLRYRADHPPVKEWRLGRIAITVLYDQLVKRKLWRYGRAGIFESYFQMIDKLIVYTKLWEMQKNKS